MMMSASRTKQLLKDHDKCVDPGIWHAIAGVMVRLPLVDSIVCYFPQGHAEHATTQVNFSGASVSIPASILCRVTSVKLLADSETDEVFTKIRLVPVHRVDCCDVDGQTILNGNANAADLWEKPTSFAKTLTQSDANNGGGFSVPRYCAETVFPPLDYAADPPVQNLLVKDVHGEVWKFRHIYRGTPRRHLLTTGWSTFVNKKKLVSGDSIVFLRTEHDELYVGIRRTTRGIDIRINNTLSGGNYGSTNGNFSKLLNGEKRKVVSKTGGFVNVRGRGRVMADSVVETAMLAASGQATEIVYYPRTSMPEFCVKATSVKAAMKIQWCSGMRFKMPFETEDSSKINWFTGTILSVQTVDSLWWPISLWRMLQVTWDEPNQLKDVQRVSPWLVEPIPSVAPIHLTPCSPPRKKLRIPQLADFPVNIPLLRPDFFPGNHPLGPSSTSAGIQGARHSQFGNISLPSFHLNNLQSRVFQTNNHHLDHPNPPSKVSTDHFVSNPNTQNDDDVSCLLTNGSPSEGLKKPSDGKTPRFKLFGQPILTVEQMSASNSGNSSSDGNHEKITSLPCEGLSCYKDYKATEPELETGQCKVFVESEDVGRTLDLSVLGSYEELYDRLAVMFGVEKSEVMRHVLYRDGLGATKCTGDEPFSEFMKTTRLTVILDSGSDDIKG